MHIDPRIRETYRAGNTCRVRPRPVPPPGANASASLPGYRRAGVGAGCVDPLPPTAPPRHALRALQSCASRDPRPIVSLTHVSSALASPIGLRAPTCLLFGPFALG